MGAEPVGHRGLLRVGEIPLSYHEAAGSPTWTRTRDNSINSRMLYQLSYRGMAGAIPERSGGEKHFLRLRRNPFIIDAHGKHGIPSPYV